MKTYYILNDMNGYGSAQPVCVDGREANRLLTEWDTDGELDFDDIWTEASRADIEQYGVYDSPDHWYLVDDRAGCRHGGDIYEDDLGEITETAAVNALWREWKHLTRGEQRDVRSFYVCTMDIDQYGCCDYDTADHIISIDDINGTNVQLPRPPFKRGEPMSCYRLPDRRIAVVRGKLLMYWGAADYDDAEDFVHDGLIGLFEDVFFDDQDDPVMPWSEGSDDGRCFMLPDGWEPPKNWEHIKGE